MAVWAIYAFDNFFEGRGFEKQKIIRGTLDEAYRVGQTMSRNIIYSNIDIMSALEGKIQDICDERSISFDSPFVTEIRNIVYANDEAWECHELDEEKLPKVDLETLNYIYEKEGYKFIEKFEVS